MKYTNISPSQSISATGGGQDVDISAYAGKVQFLFASRNTAGSTPTHARKIQTSDILSRGLEQSTAGATDNKLNSGATTNVRLGLKFTQSGTRSVKRVALRLKNPGTITAGKKLTLAIQTNNAGAPSGTAVQNGTAGTVLCSAVPAAYGWVVFTFANPVDLTDATIYHLVLSCDYTADSTNCIYWRSLTVASGGTVETYNNTTWAAVTATESFEVYVDQYNFADVPGLSQTGASDTVTVNEAALIDADTIQGVVVRVYDTIGGTGGPAFAASCDLVGGRTVMSS